MSFLDRIRTRIKASHDVNKMPEPTNVSTAIDPIQEEEKVDPAEYRDPPEYQIPVQVGEYFPWKGHVFKVTLTCKMMFSAECVGITASRAKKREVR